MDTSETGLEKIIVDWLVLHNGYEQETPHAFNKDFALVDKWVERFVTETQPGRAGVRCRGYGHHHRRMA